MSFTIAKWLEAHIKLQALQQRPYETWAFLVGFVSQTKQEKLNAIHQVTLVF